MEDETNKPTFASGAMSLTLTQQDMAQAVEYWLNGTVMKVPVRVTKMEKSKPRDVLTSGTFSVLIVEKDETDDIIDIVNFVEELVK